jgi:ATP-dependent exoDNAse (exonuclease V) beta subunit
MEDGLPGDDVLLALARKEGPGLSRERMTEWVRDFRAWMEATTIRASLSRDAYPDGARVERELPFFHRIPDGILQGYIDRLVLWEEGGKVVGAEVLDFKTDMVEAGDPHALEAKVSFYRPQIDAYRTAVAGRYGLDESDVSGKLLFLRPGVVQEV